MRAPLWLLSFALLVGPWTLVCQTARAVEPGVPVERIVTPGATDRHEIRLQTGQFLHVVVEQNHLDAAVRIAASDGTVLAEADNAADEEDPITLSIVGPREGLYFIEIRLRGQKSAKGRYRLSVDPPRAATSEDGKTIEAERLRSEGDVLLARAAAASSRNAVEKYEQAVLAWRALGNRREEAATLDRIADTLGWLGDLRPALEHAERALALWKEIGDRRGEAAALDEVGVAHSRIGEQRLALPFFEQALATRHEDGNLRGQAETLNNMAMARSGLGEYPEALARYTDAIGFAREAGDRVIEATMLKNRAVNFAVLGDLDRALADLKEALSRFREIGDRHQEGVTLYSVGNVYLDRGDVTGALDHYRLALPLLQKAGDKLAEAVTVNHMGLADLSARRTKEALAEFEGARELLHASGDRRREAAVMGNIARAHLEMGDAARAHDLFREALPLIQASGDRGNEATVLVHLARTEQAMGNLEAAHARIEEALRFTESLRGSIPAVGERASYMAKTRDRYDLLIEILMALHAKHPDQGWDAEALHASERANARSLVELLAEAHIDLREGIDENLLAQEKALDAELEKRRRETELRLAGGGPPAPDPGGRTLDALLAEFEDVQGRLRSASPRYAALARPEPLSLKEIREQVLDPETLLLEYALGEERSFVWAVTPSTLSSHELPKRAIVEAAVLRLYRAWSVANGVEDAEVARRARAVSRMILGPVADQLGGKRLAIVAEGALHYLPFAALPLPSTSSGDAPIPVVARHEVVSLPSATTLAILRRESLQRRSPDRLVAVLADPVFDREDPRVVGRTRPPATLRPNALGNEELTGSMEETGLRHLQRLAASRREAQAIERLAGRAGTLRALDFQASRATALSPEVSRSRIIHFASHGLLNSRRPELSGIVLSLVDKRGNPVDGFLQTRDIYKLKLSADLVVLSGCQTALGKDVRGEGLVGLARGFMYAGAPKVVASLWPVPDRATAELMTRFYVGILKKGLPPAAALREAQVAIRNRRAWSSPYYWAAFTLQGDWN